MLTQCPKCDAIYRLGATELGAAQGYVECGDCGEQFNALARLADEPKFARPAIEQDEASVDPKDAATHKRSSTDTNIDAPDPSEAKRFEPLSPVFSAPNVGATATASGDAESTESAPSSLPPSVDSNTSAAPPPDEHESPQTQRDKFDEADLISEADQSAIVPLPIDDTTTNLLASHGLDIKLDREPSEPSDQDALTTSLGPELDIENGEEAVVEVEIADELSDDIPIAPQRPPTSTLGAEEHAILFTELESTSADDEQLQAPDPETAPEPELQFDDVPAILQNEYVALHKPPSRKYRWLWRSLALILFTALTAQLLWVSRDNVRAIWPGATVAYANVCLMFGCEVDRVQAEEIELIARDVRDHPQYRDALLVNATLISRAEIATPFPVIELGLRGSDGELIGIRRFEPQEYLDKSIDIEGGMPPRRPVYIVLEVAQSGGHAVSFEFNFL